MAGNHGGLLQDMYESRMTVMRGAVGVTEVGEHQEGALSPFLFAIMMDR